jgi:hypothetical protein
MLFEFLRIPGHDENRTVLLRGSAGRGASVQGRSFPELHFSDDQSRRRVLMPSQGSSQLFAVEQDTQTAGDHGHNDKAPGIIVRHEHYHCLRLLPHHGVSLRSFAIPTLSNRGRFQ